MAHTGNPTNAALPGFDHCGIQQGPGVADTGMDLLTALENWVEKGRAPSSIVMTRRDKDGKPLWSRPLCVFPQRAKLLAGDAKDAASYQCSRP
jgi:feruloyl esterase